MHNPTEHAAFDYIAIHRAVLAAADRHADNVALQGDGGLGKVYTYAEVAKTVRRFTATLHHNRASARPEIGLLSENRPEWCLAYLAILAAGRTVVPIDANLTEQEISYIAGHARLESIIASKRYEHLVEKMPNVRLLSLDEDSPAGWQHLPAGEPAPDIPPAAVAVLIYTSGTTGMPKAVELTHRNILANLDGIRDAIAFDQRDRFLSVLPLHHTYEATCGFLAPLMSGSCVTYARSLKSKELLEDIARNSITVMCGVPLLYEKMYHAIRRGINAAPLAQRLLFKTTYASSLAAWQGGMKLGKSLFSGLRAKAGLASLRLFSCGGAALPAETARFFNVIGIDLLQGYGLTECSPVVSTNRPDNVKFGSIGPPLKNIEVKINDPGPDGIGEILVRSEANTAGYRDNPTATAELIRDGWLHTGDLARFKGGHLWITGRMKSVIVSAAGKNIYPEELEEKLMASEYVAETIVYGRRKQDKQGEEVRAIIVPEIESIAADYPIDRTAPDLEVVEKVIAEVVSAANHQVASFKRISAYEVRLAELDKTSTRKVKRYLYK